MPTDEGRTGAPERRRVRAALGVFIAGLVVSGVTAFPLVTEVEILCRMFGVDDPAAPFPAALREWLGTVREGLRHTSVHYPFLFYGTDWLAFSHLVIAGFFVPPLRDPVRYVGNLHVGLWACAGVLVLAAICGPLRGIAWWWWGLADCAFGVFAAPLLLYALRQVRRLETLRTANVAGSPPLPRAG